MAATTNTGHLLPSAGICMRGRLSCPQQHLIAHRLHDYSAMLHSLDARSRDFH
jgi:hypothetical protein